jgi:hypothetical protein
MNSTMDDAIDARRHGDQITALVSECTEGVFQLGSTESHWTVLKQFLLSR